MIAAAAIIGYLFGSIPFSLIAGRVATGKDVRDFGSGNMGATNVMRVAGKGAAAVALLGDILKGLVAIVLVRLLGGGPAESAVAAVASVLGHGFPLFAGFRGGKGVATGFGAFFLLSPAAVLGSLALFAVVLASTRMVSLGSMLAFASLPAFAALLKAPAPVVAAGLFLCCLVIVRHRANIRRIIGGTEPRIGRSGNR